MPTVLVGWVVLLVANLLGPRVVVLPNLGNSGQIPTPFIFFLGGLLALLAVLLGSEPCPGVYVTAPARARLINVTRVALASLAGPLLLTIVGPGDWAATTNTTVTVTGEALLAASAFGLRLAWLPPLLHLAGAASFGAATRETLHGWAWLISAQPTAAAWTASVCVWVLGLLTWLALMARNPDGLEV